ncbi:hypothetical protein KP509_11G098000 [Ceratopteris richardii]|uniref:K Homology domain-containing protein n=1 Tax=Ceratopteris richardii TaxID=49495 RepID=A0A8T2TYB6_CERRI|nr:hypothetical protein KP509_11G098000 [Ceratopteris richardii]
MKSGVMAAAAPAAAAAESLGNAHKRAREDGEAVAFPAPLLPPRQERWPGWPGDNVFRLLVPAHKVGAIIGRKGEFVRRMCEETKSRIKILDGIVGTAERVVMVSAREEPDAFTCPAIDGLLKVHQRTLGLIEGVEGYPSANVDLASPVASKLLVAVTQAGNLIGRQGAIIKYIQDTAGATLRILPPEDLPLCALQDDRIVEMHGEPMKVHKAIELAVTHLRKFLVDRSVLPLFELNKAVQNQYQLQVAHAAWVPSVTPVTNSNVTNFGNAPYYDSSSYQQNCYYQTSTQIETQQQHEEVMLYNKDSGSVSDAPVGPVITQVTQCMQVPLSYADTIIGIGGANLSSFQTASGATINVQEAAGCPQEMNIELQGSSFQVQTAVQLIQNSITMNVPSATSDAVAQPGAAMYSTLHSNSYTPLSDSMYTTASSTSANAGGYPPSQQPVTMHLSAGHTAGVYGS